jgi:hypothetical protein
MEEGFLKIDGCYMFCFLNKRKSFVKVLNVFANNFVEVHEMNGGYRSRVRKSDFNNILCTKSFVNLNNLEEIQEVAVVD